MGGSSVAFDEIIGDTFDNRSLALFSAATPLTGNDGARDVAAVLIPSLRKFLRSKESVLEMLNRFLDRETKVNHPFYLLISRSGLHNGQKTVGQSKQAKVARLRY
jgi:hypothetical protein